MATIRVAQILAGNLMNESLDRIWTSMSPIDDIVNPDNIGPGPYEFVCAGCNLVAHVSGSLYGYCRDCNADDAAAVLAHIRRAVPLPPVNPLLVATVDDLPLVPLA